MKKLYIAVFAIGLFVTAAAFLIALFAFSDASFRCPGMQCSDALFIGSGSAIVAIIGIIITLLGYRRFKLLGRLV